MMNFERTLALAGPLVITNNNFAWAPLGDGRVWPFAFSVAPSSVCEGGAFESSAYFLPEQSARIQ
jgi:hypothetical protein